MLRTLTVALNAAIRQSKIVGRAVTLISRNADIGVVEVRPQGPRCRRTGT